MGASSFDNSFFFFSLSTKKTPCGGFAEMDPLPPKPLQVPRSRPISIDISFSQPFCQSEVRNYIISELSTRSQFFALFSHSMRNPSPSYFSHENNRHTTDKTGESFEKYVICYMNNWEYVYTDHVGYPPLKIDQRLISQFKRYEHDRLNSIEWRVSSTLLKEIKPQVATQLINAVKEVKIFEKILLKYFDSQNCELKTLPSLSGESFLKETTLTDYKHKPKTLLPQIILRYYLVSYYPNYQELWYPFDVLLEKSLVQDINLFHLQWPYPSSVILDYWFHPNDGEEFL